MGLEKHLSLGCSGKERVRREKKLKKKLHRSGFPWLQRRGGALHGEIAKKKQLNSKLTDDKANAKGLF